MLNKMNLPLFTGYPYSHRSSHGHILFYLKILDQILFPTHVVRTKFDIYVFFLPLPIRQVKIDSISH